MPIKIFAAPGDHRNNFESLEDQVNQWMATKGPKVLSMHSSVTEMKDRKDIGSFMLTMVIHYDESGG